ncbi:hypothetical protein [Nonomuraea typhae]|uniref:Ig-like domain-containing protein n=1 Tax=Nonomuraea typhae TaxID=2603600 RepID=A0ABW7YQ70_9ACTN
MTIKRFAIIVGAALLATSTLAAPARASSALAYICDSGGVRDDGYGALTLHGGPCLGPWFGASNAEVLLKSGPDAGTYFCKGIGAFGPQTYVLGLTCHRR